MAKRVGVDKWMFGTVLLLVLFGLVMVFSASAVMAKETVGSPYAYVRMQALWALLGMVALTVLMRVDYRRYNSYPVVVGCVAVTTLLLLGVFVMHGMNGAHRWIRVAGTTLEPSELAKPVIVLFLAYFLQTRIHAMDDWKGTILRAALPPLVFIALILKEPAKINLNVLLKTVQFCTLPHEIRIRRYSRNRVWYVVSHARAWIKSTP